MDGFHHVTSPVTLLQILAHISLHDGNQQISETFVVCKINSSSKLANFQLILLQLQLEGIETCLPVSTECQCLYVKLSLFQEPRIELLRLIVVPQKTTKHIN